MRTYAYAAFLAVAILAGLVAFFVLVILPDEGRNRVVSEGQGGSEQVEERPTTGPTRRGTPVRSAGTRTTSSEDDGETAHSDESSGTEIDALPIPSGGAILTIIVQEVDGAPVVDAPVSLRAGRAEDERITERDGSAVFAGIAPGVYSYIVSVEGRPQLTSARPVEIQDNESVELIVQIGRFDRSISGRVLTDKGEPLQGIEIYALPYLFQAGPERAIPYRQDTSRVLSDEEGRFVIENLEDGEYELRTVATETFAEARTVVRAGVDSVDLVLRATRDVRVFGIVTDPDGVPLADVRVLPVGQAARSALTDVSGRYELDLALSGERRVFTFRFLRNGFQEHQATVSQEEIEAAIELELDAELLPIKGLTEVFGVLRGPEGEPVPGETIHLHSELLKSRHQATSDDEGRFVVPEIQAGMDYRVWVRPQGRWRDYTQKNLHVKPSGTTLDITLEPLGFGSVRGYMVDGSGNPVPSFSLWLRSTEAASKSVEVTSGVDGYFAVDEVPAGPLLFETRSLPRFTLSGYELRPDEVAEFRLTVDWGDYEMRGRVVDVRGVPIAGANVYLSWFHREGEIRSSATRTATADDRGEFEFTRLGPGIHRVNVNAPGYRAAQANHDVVSGGRVIEIRLDPSS